MHCVNLIFETTLTQSTYFLLYKSQLNFFLLYNQLSMGEFVDKIK